jgi:hypothetical protein
MIQRDGGRIVASLFACPDSSVRIVENSDRLLGGPDQDFHIVEDDPVRPFGKRPLVPVENSSPGMFGLRRHLRKDRQ